MCPTELQTLVFEHGILLNAQRLDVLFDLASHCTKLKGEFWECGVYRGGSARVLAEVIARTSPHTLRLFDTFSGLPESDPSIDLHQQGEFSSPCELTRSFVNEPFVSIHQGLIPQSFRGLETCSIAFCHVDVDLYRSTRDVIEFVWPRLVSSGLILFDDYQWPESPDQSCPGAHLAVDQFFRGIAPVLRTEASPEQAVVFKL